MHHTACANLPTLRFFMSLLCLQLVHDSCLLSLQVEGCGGLGRGGRRAEMLNRTNWLQALGVWYVTSSQTL